MARWGGQPNPEPGRGLSLLLTDQQHAALNAGHVVLEAWSDGTFAASDTVRTVHGATPRLAIEALEA